MVGLEPEEKGNPPFLVFLQKFQPRAVKAWAVFTGLIWLLLFPPIASLRRFLWVGPKPKHQPVLLAPVVVFRPWTWCAHLFVCVCVVSVKLKECRGMTCDKVPEGRSPVCVKHTTPSLFNVVVIVRLNCVIVRRRERQEAAESGWSQGHRRRKPQIT